MRKLFKFISKLITRNRSKLFFLIPLISLLLLGALLYSLKSVFVVALVNNQPISRFALNRELEKQAGQKILEDKISEILITQEIKKKGIKIDQISIDAKIKEIEEELKAQGQNQGLDALLSLQGMTRKDLEKQISLQLSVEKMLGSDIQITEEELKKSFEQNKALYPKGTTFESKKESLKIQLEQQKMAEKFQSWLASLRQNAKINYFVQF